MRYRAWRRYQQRSIIIALRLAAWRTNARAAASSTLSLRNARE